MENTKAIYSLVKMSFEEDDWSTWNFMQWFVKEQIEEETLAMSLLDKIKIAGGEKVSDEALYLLDRGSERNSGQRGISPGGNGRKTVTYMNQISLYPLCFEPIYQYRLWGGRHLADLLTTPLPGNDPIGEAWLLSDREDHKAWCPMDR